MGDRLIMSKKERQRKALLEGVKQGHMTLKEAAKRLKISYRQSKRIWKRYQEEEDTGLVHRSRGRRSSHAYPEDFKTTVISTYQKRYAGFGCRFAVEKLCEYEGLVVHEETLRLWLKGSGLWQARRRGNPHRKRRIRRERFGEMLQIDGSDHAWFGAEAGRSCLLNMVDDATGFTLAQMDDGETTAVLLSTLKIWIERYGIPKSVYVDLKTVYLSPKGRKWSEDDEEVRAHFSVFERVCERLGIEIIEAYSPQAKGRVERKHQVFQDRFLKDMALRGIQTLEEANQFLLEGFLNEINDKFAVSPASHEDAHRSIESYGDLNQIFCWEHQRIVKNDWTIQFEKECYQIQREAVRIKPRDKVLVRQHLDKSLSIWYKENRIAVERVERVIKAPVIKSPEGDGYDAARRSEHSRCNKWKTPWSQYNPHWLKGGSPHPAGRVMAEKKSATG
jgi:transposase